MTINITDNTSKIVVNNTNKNINIEVKDAVKVQNNEQTLNANVTSNPISVKDHSANPVSIKNTKEDIFVSPKRGPQGEQGIQGIQGVQGIQGATGQGSNYIGPEFTYTNDRLSRIDYDNNAYKTITYNSDNSVNTVILTEVSGATITKTFVYNTDGTLDEIIQT